MDAHARVHPIRCLASFAEVRLELDDVARTRLVVELARISRGRSEDLVEMVVERAWKHRRLADLPKPDGFDVSLEAHLERWSSELLRDEGGTVRLRVDPATPTMTAGECDALLRWRWTTLFVPKALVLGGLPSSVASEVELVPSVLRPGLFGGPWAELHLHASAANDFDSWWVESLMSAGAATGEHAARLRAAAFLRWLLHASLWGGLRLDDLHERLASLELSAEREMLAKWFYAATTGRVPQPEQDGTLQLGDLAAPFGYSGSGWAAAGWRSADRSGLPSPDDADVPAPTNADVNCQGAELELVRRAMAAWRENSLPPEVRKVFWQYQRLRLMSYQDIVACPGVPGLRCFKRHYDRIGDSARGLFERAVDLEARSLRLSALEIRPRVPKRSHTQTALRRFAESAAAALNRRTVDRPELGLVLSLIKPSTRGEGRPAPGSIRFASFIEDQIGRTEALVEFVDEQPLLLALVRGVDVASQELGAPTWAVAPFLRRVRDASAATVSRVGHLALKPLGVTAHVGEEAHSPFEGLRRVHELISTKTLATGDRIGHGLALGCTPELALRRSLLQPREERIFDLLWELELGRRADVAPDGARADALRAEIQRLLDQTGLALPPAAALDELPRLLLAADHATLASWLHTPPQQAWANAYLTRTDIWARLSEPIEVRFDQADELALGHLRSVVVRAASEAGLVLETNPTSNLVIGDLGALSEHPVFRLAPLDPAAQAFLRVAVCDDDPITFATCLGDEVVYTFAALNQLHRPNPEEAVLAWIERARTTAWNARFTVAQGADAELMERLATDLLLPAPRPDQ